MKKITQLWLASIVSVLFLTNGCTNNALRTNASEEPKKIIIETDFTYDVDDVGALAVLHALADMGEADILAVCYNEVQRNAEKAIDAVNTWYGRGTVSIGLYDKDLKDPDDAHSFYIDKLAELHHDLSDNIVDTALNVYRETLSSQEDGSVTIVSVGFLNNLYDLLVAEPDLVRQKVSQLVLMGGNANDNFNFVRHDTVAQTQYVIEHWPGPVVISQEGSSICTGSGLEAVPEENPIRTAYYWWTLRSWGETGIFNDRSSWDQMAVLYAVRGSRCFSIMDNRAGMLQNGYMWQMAPNYRMLLINKLSNRQYSEIIEELMTKDRI